MTLDEVICNDNMYVPNKLSGTRGYGNKVDLIWVLTTTSVHCADIGSLFSPIRLGE